VGFTGRTNSLWARNCGQQVCLWAKKNKIGAGSKQADLFKKMEAAKLQNQGGVTTDESTNEVTGTDEGTLVPEMYGEFERSTVRSSSGSMYGEFERAFSADDDRGRALDLGYAGSLDGVTDRMTSTWASGRVEYLKPGQPAPLEEWAKLLVGSGVELTQGMEGVGGGGRPLVAIVTHYLESSAKLREAAVEMAAKLPRKSFAADLAVVSRDPWGATAKLAKVANGARGSAVTFLSAHGAPEWFHAFGVTDQLVEFGVSVFVVERETASIFAVSYDCDPDNVATFIKKAAEAFELKKNKPNRPPPPLPSTTPISRIKRAPTADPTPPKTPSQPQTPQPQASLTDELVKLGELKEKGLLSEAEFDAAKSKVLAVSMSKYF